MLDPANPISVASKALDLISGFLFSREEEFELVAQLMEEDTVFKALFGRVCNSPMVTYADVEYAQRHVQIIQSFVERKHSLD